MIKEKTTVTQKELQKCGAPSKCSPIMRLLIMWKLLTAKIKEDISYSLISRGLFSEEPKDAIMGIIDLPYIDLYKIKESKKRRKK